MSKRVHLAGVLFSVLFGFSFMFSKVALDFVMPIGLIAYRFMAAFLVLELLRWLNVVTIRFRKAHIKSIFIVAILQPVLYFLFEVYGLARTTSSEAGMMIALIPIFVTIFSAIILKERAKVMQIVFILLSVSGIIFIQIMQASSGVEVEILGFLLLLGAVLSAALFTIASRYASVNVKAYELTYFMMLFGAVTFNGIYLFVLFVEGRPFDYVSNLFFIELLVPILYLGVAASIGGFFLVNYTLGKLEAHVSSIYANLATVTAILAGTFILREPIFWYHYLGGVMIITGVYGTVRLNRGIKRMKTNG